MTAATLDRGRAKLKVAVLGALGIVAVLAVWEAVGRLELLGNTWPPLTQVLATVTDDAKQGLFRRALSATAGAAVKGYLLGTVLAVALAAVALVVPFLRAGIHRLAAVLHAVPVIALGPLFIVTLSREGTPTAISTLAVLFTTFVAATAGFEAATPSHHDLLTVLGAARTTRFTRLELPAALPALVDGAKLGAPAAVLGAILGEWFGAPVGLGTLIVSAMQNYQIDLLWSAALIGAVLSMLAYGALSVVDRWVAARFRP